MICVDFRCLLIVGGLIALTVPETSVAQGLPDCQGASGNLSQSLGPQALGLPQMTDDTLAADDTSACCHENYCTRFNHVTNMPAWVYERLTPAVVVGMRIPGYSATHSDSIWPPKPEYPATCGALR